MDLEVGGVVREAEFGDDGSGILEGVVEGFVAEFFRKGGAVGEGGSVNVTAVVGAADALVDLGGDAELVGFSIELIVKGEAGGEGFEGLLFLDGFGLAENLWVRGGDGGEADAFEGGELEEVSGHGGAADEEESGGKEVGGFGFHGCQFTVAR